MIIETRKSKTLIDHVISTIPNGVIHDDIVHTEEISDHDAPYVIFTIKKKSTNHARNLYVTEKLLT